MNHHVKIVEEKNPEEKNPEEKKMNDLQRKEHEYINALKPLQYDTINIHKIVNSKLNKT
jgi:hypothetical protein